MSATDKAVTFELPSGAEVTAPLELAKKLGYQPPKSTPKTK